MEAAKKAYIKLSKSFIHSGNKFKFSLAKVKNISQFDIKNLDSKNIYHFKVAERVDKKNNINFEIKTINKVKNVDAFKIEIHEKIKGFTKQQNGGKHKKSKHIVDDSSSSSSSSSDDYKVRKSKYYAEPFYNWWYNPFIYNSDSVYIPSIVAPYAMQFWPFTVSINNKVTI
jgi:hypothetical protein